MKQRLFSFVETLALVAALAAIAALIACGASSTSAPPPATVAATPVPPTATPTPVPPTATPRPTPTVKPTATQTPTLAPEGPALPVTVTDADGNEVVVEDISRIISLNGDITEVIFALGLGEKVVAVDTSATYPPEALALTKIGYQRSLSAEGILSLNPTVIIGNQNAGPPEVINQLRATGVTVVILDSVSTIDGAAHKIRGVAQALGVPGVGEEIAAGLEQEIEEIGALTANAQDKPSAVFLYIRGLDSLFLIGEDHLSHELFEASGAISGASAAGVTEAFIPLTAESLAAANPDCIVVLTAGLQSVGGREGLLKLPGVGQTAAAETGCILDFDDQYFGGGGPRLGSVLMDLLKAFHPALAP